MENPENVIRAYIEHLQEPSYAQAAISEHGFPVLITTVVRMVQTFDPSEVRDATLFARDLSQGLLGDELAARAAAVLPTSGLFEALAQCLTMSNFGVRSQAVYTFGKLGFRENIHFLDRTFRERRDVDPLLMTSLLFEIFWLENDDEKHWVRARHLADSPNDLSRWAALGVIEKHFKHEPVTMVDEILLRLSRDPFPFIRAEASYRRAECARRIQNRALSKDEFKSVRAEVRAEKSRVEALRPSMTFEDLETAFWNVHTNPDYTTADVLAFLKSHERAG